MQQGTLYRLAAFAEGERGGNPAGVWVGEQLPDAGEMQRIAAEVGYSETAFVAPTEGRVCQVRYFSPAAEVSFCGHATIAAGVALARLSGSGRYRFDTAVGPVRVDVVAEGGQFRASLESVATTHRAVSDAVLQGALAALGWRENELDRTMAPSIAYAGAWHLVLAVARHERLATLDYDFERLRALMHAEKLTTLQLVWREHEALFHARNPFPVGGVVEDPATGAAAAALGGYLRDAGLVTVPHRFEILQGAAMGRPSRLVVDVPACGGVLVAGLAIDIAPSQP